MKEIKGQEQTLEGHHNWDVAADEEALPVKTGMVLLN